MSTPQIQIYCTVGTDELCSDTQGGLTCTRCMKTLVDLDDPAAVSRAMKAGKGLPCGFVRRMAVPALASSLLLSACDSKNPPPHLMGEIAAEPPEKSEIQMPPRILPGLIAPPKAKGNEATTPVTAEPPQKPRPLMGRIAPPPLKNPEGKEWPVARTVPNRPGFIYSPYTNKIVDVARYPANSLVCDPDSAMSERKYFRVPATETR